MAEVLRVIASSPTDVRAALQTIVDAAVRLCDAHGGNIMQVRERDGRLAARVIFGAPAHDLLGNTDPFNEQPGLPATRDSAAGRALVDGRTIHIPNVDEAALTEFPASRGLLSSRFSAVLNVPLRGRLAQSASLACCAGSPGRSLTSAICGQRELVASGTARSPAVHRPADRAAGDVRGPGRHRHRERPAVRGAGAAQPPSLTRGAGAADRHRRDPAGHRLLAHGACSPSWTPSLSSALRLSESVERARSPSVRATICAWSAATNPGNYRHRTSAFRWRSAAPAPSPCSNVGSST